ncbi:hypothetical protein [Dactylosporangium sp. NPDC000521]|uniref:hypothetical protein n=1 Tax=Dactylosporangium sp. NPDC000521 TaxID=3363975 RepID=UPI0036C339C0
MIAPILARIKGTVHSWTRSQRIAATSVVLLVLTGATWLLWPGDPPAPAPRERHYKATTACLLTDDHGLNGDPAKAAWAGMQKASVETLVKVQHLAISGPQNAANGVTYYNTLGVQKCTVIIAAGPVPVAAMVDGLASFPDIKHFAIGGDTKDKPVTAVDATTPETIQAGTHAAVASAA